MTFRRSLGTYCMDSGDTPQSSISVTIHIRLKFSFMKTAHAAASLFTLLKQHRFTLVAAIGGSCAISGALSCGMFTPLQYFFTPVLSKASKPVGTTSAAALTWQNYGLGHLANLSTAFVITVSNLLAKHKLAPSLFETVSFQILR